MSYIVIGQGKIDAGFTSFRGNRVYLRATQGDYGLELHWTHEIRAATIFMDVDSASLYTRRVPMYTNQLEQSSIKVCALTLSPVDA